MFSALTSYNHAYTEVGCKKWLCLIFLSDLFHEVVIFTSSVQYIFPLYVIHVPFISSFLLFDNPNIQDAK